ncbi:MAG: PhzF family phenazine biosynthesis protein [Chloroflexi bacterium]|nr:PhzF family phenazine biosynthesis protein [Chloroflexota bacterium]
MRNIRFYIVDVFAESRYSGNQLAVFRSGNAISEDEMQQIAREMNFSETSFITCEIMRQGGFNVRIFTPGEEIPFAGHPTLGTAHIIRTEINPQATGKIVLNLKVGQIPVTFDDTPPDETIYWMQQIEPVFGERINAEVIAPILNLTIDDIDERFPIEEVSTGLPHILVPLRSLDALKRSAISREPYFKFIENRWAKPVMIFCPQPHQPENDISVRMFAECFGITEDPATGSGNGCLAGYLARHRYFGKDSIDIRAEQGYEIGRPSLLLLRAQDREGRLSVSVGGKAVTIARGEFY